MTQQKLSLKIILWLRKIKYYVEDQPGETTVENYINWINSCGTIVTNDSLGLHIALALKKKVIILFGDTNADEVYMYDRGIKIQKESRNINDITYDEVIEKVKEIINE